MSMEISPKEKAKELVEDFTFTCRECNSEENAKQCALIAVNKLLEQLNHLPTEGYGMQYIGIIEHWEEVKQEIEKL